jgi:tetratricopeptide (TPR) repeat protein
MRLEGSFEALIEPVTQGGSLRSYVSVEGDLASTSLVSQKAPLAPLLKDASSSGGVGILSGVVLGAVLAGGGGYLLHRRVRRAPAVPVTTSPAIDPLSPALAAEYYVGLGEQALQFGEQAKALHYISLAREACPTSADVATTMAFVLGELGHYDEALAAYEDAARLAAQAGKPPEAVEALVVRALERTPEFVFDVEEDLEFRPLAIRPAFRDALARAWDRWGDGEDPAIGR